MEKLLSYHNDPAVKDKYVARFAAHRALDQVNHGTGFDNGGGCFVGCTLDAYDHSRFPVDIGWPEWLVRLAETIFEGLPSAEAQEFVTNLLDSVPAGIDLEPVCHMLAVRRIDRLIALQRGNLGKNGPSVDAVINGSISSLEVARRCHESEIAGDSCDWAAESVAKSAWSVAKSEESAALSAKSAAKSAGWSANSPSKSAAWSAESAAWSAESAAWSAALSEAYQVERNDLLDILRSLKP